MMPKPALWASACISWTGRERSCWCLPGNSRCWDSPRELVGTSWRLVDDEGIYGGGDATTLLFLTSWAATGTTICRDYSIGYTASEGRIRIPSMGMSGSSEPCSSEASRQEHQFIEDFGWADEYSIDQAGEVERLEVRTSRGKTLAFEPLPQSADATSDGRWRLIRFLESRSDDSGMRWPRNTDVGVSENITATFDAWIHRRVARARFVRVPRCRKGRNAIGGSGWNDLHRRRFGCREFVRLRRQHLGPAAAVSGRPADCGAVHGLRRTVGDRHVRRRRADLPTGIGLRPGADRLRNRYVAETGLRWAAIRLRRGSVPGG